MQVDEKAKIIEFVIRKLTPLIDTETGKFHPIHFKKNKLVKALALEEKDCLHELTEKQLAQLINAARDDSICWELLCLSIASDLEEGYEIPSKIARFCMDYTTGIVKKPKAKKTSNTRDFIVLFLAKVISERFEIQYSRNETSNPEKNYSALDAISDAFQKIEGCVEKLQFSSLSRLRSNNPEITQVVDIMWKKRFGYTRRNSGNL